MFFPILDIDKDGSIQFLELVENFAIFAHGPREISDIKFKLYDQDGSGNLTRRQLASGISRDVRLMILFQTLWTKVAIKKTLLLDEKVKHSIEHSINRMTEFFSDPVLTEKSVEVYFQVGDVNNDEKFSRQEYIDFHKNHALKEQISKIWKGYVAEKIPDEILHPGTQTLSPRKKNSLNSSHNNGVTKGPLQSSKNGFKSSLQSSENGDHK